MARYEYSGGTGIIGWGALALSIAGPLLVLNDIAHVNGLTFSSALFDLIPKLEGTLSASEMDRLGAARGSLLVLPPLALVAKFMLDAMLEKRTGVYLTKEEQEADGDWSADEAGNTFWRGLPVRNLRD